MTKRAPIRQADLKRTVKAALEAGLRVGCVEVKPDGTILIRAVDQTPPQAFSPEPLPEENEWDEVLK